MKNNSISHYLVNRNKQRRLVRTVISFFVISLIALSILISGVKISAVTADAEGLDTGSSVKMYKSVMVEQNDCIWDIAERYMGNGYSDTRDYVEEIIEINNLTGTEIHFGEYLCIPYYG